MKIRMLCIGVPGETGPIETAIDEPLTIEEFLALFSKVFKEKKAEDIQEKFSLLLNGRNVLSLPAQFKTKLEDGDELMVTVQVMGG